MKTPSNAFSKKALAAVFAASAVVPVAAVSAETPATVSIDTVLVVKGEQTYSIDRSTYIAALQAGFVAAADVKYISATNGKTYSLSNYRAALQARGSATAALEVLNTSNFEETVEFVEGSFDQGGLVPVESTPLEVIEISSITDTGVTVTFPSLGTAVQRATVEVIDPAGNKVTVVEQNLKAGTTKATFVFKEKFGKLADGTWTIGKLKKSLDSTAPVVSDITIYDIDGNAVAATVSKENKTITFDGVVSGSEYNYGKVTLSEDAVVSSLGNTIQVKANAKDTNLVKLLAGLFGSEDGQVFGSTLIGLSGETIVFTDAAGNSAEYEIKVIPSKEVDKTAPTVSGITIYDLDGNAVAGNVNEENKTISFDDVVSSKEYNYGRVTLSEDATVSALGESVEVKADAEEADLVKLLASLFGSEDGQVFGSTLISFSGETIIFTDAAGNSSRYAIKVNATTSVK